MDQNIEKRSSTAQRFISDEIGRALARAGLDYDLRCLIVKPKSSASASPWFVCLARAVRCA